MIKPSRFLSLLAKTLFCAPPGGQPLAQGGACPSLLFTTTPSPARLSGAGRAHYRGPSWLPHDPARDGVVLRSDGQPRPLLEKHAKNFTIRTILTSQKKAWRGLALIEKNIEMNNFIDTRN